MALVLKNSGVPVICMVHNGEADSAAFLLLEHACTIRAMDRLSKLMWHHAKFLEVTGDRDDLAAYSKNLDDFDTELAESLSNRMKVSKKDILNHVANHKEWWMTWAEAQEVGAIDIIFDDPLEFLADLGVKMKALPKAPAND